MLNRVCLLLIGIITVACGESEAAREISSTPSCAQRLSGTWKFGRAPVGCVISSSISDPLEEKYKPLVFDESKTIQTEEGRFTREMHDFMVDYAKTYLERREPAATENQITAWVRLVLSTAHQESYWTQYRFGNDSQFRIFRGDGGHGHGMMQIDDRWHKTFIRSNKVYDINPHMLYSLDMLFDLRKRIKRRPCSGKNDGVSINRSVYSAYNGGYGSRCRWTRTSRWSKNNRGFYEKYQDQKWTTLMTAAND